jgi:hypothetical protein
MSEADLIRRRAEGKWSPAEVLEHLSLTYSGTVKNLERSLKAEKPLGGIPTLKQRVINTVILDFGYLPEGRKSPEAARPKGMPAGQISGEINNRIAAMDDVIRKCEDKFGKRSMVADHPILGPLRMEQWSKFHLVHGKHHAKQILRMREKS